MLAPIHEFVHIPLPDGGTLVGDLSYAQTTGDFAVVWVHGLGSNRGGEKAQALEAACSRRRWTFAAFDFRGHGQSSSTLRDMRATRLVQDLQAVQSCLRERGIGRIALVGSSMGAFAAAWFAVGMQREVVPACVFIAPSFSFLDRLAASVSPAELDAWRQTRVREFQNEWIAIELGYGMLEERVDYPLVGLVQQWSLPTLIFHGMQDRTVPWEESVHFVQSTQRAQAELRLYREGDHRLTAFKDEIAEETCRFLARWLE